MRVFVYLDVYSTVSQSAISKRMWGGSHRRREGLGGGGSTHKQSRDFIEDIDDFTGCRALVYCFSRHGDTCLRGSETFARLFTEK
jgi:hypothetical protein